jgi:ABC-type transport system involved in multi-copper enzyme maturation permease subunit
MGAATRGTEDIEAIVASISAVSLLEQILALSFLPTLFAIFVSIFVSSEFHNGTIKNYVAKGFNRTRMYLSKLFACCIAVLAMYIVHVAATCSVGSLMWGFDPYGVATFANVAAMILNEGLLLLAYTSVFVLISIWLRSNGASLAVNICAVSIIPTLLIASNYIVGDSITLSNVWISGSISNLATLTPESGNVLLGVTVGVCYLLGGAIAGSTLFNKMDIK